MSEPTPQQPAPPAISGRRRALAAAGRATARVAALPVAAVVALARFIGGTAKFADDLVRTALREIYNYARSSDSHAVSVNLLSEAALFVAAIAFSIAPLIEAVVRLFKPHAELGVPVLPLFYSLLGFSGLCLLVIAALEVAVERAKANRE